MPRSTSLIPPHDLHVHTWLSPCGNQQRELSCVRAYAEEAARRGFSTIGIADHFALPAPWVPTWYANSGVEMLDKVLAAASEVQSSVEILVGCEADMIAPDKVTIDAATAGSLDYVMLSASHLHLVPDRRAIAAAGPKEAARVLVRFLDAAVRLPFVDIVAHPLVVPTDPFGPPGDYIGLISDSQIEAVTSRAAAASVALEMNAKVFSREDYREILKRFYSIARSCGCRFTVGTDSHEAAGMHYIECLETYVLELGFKRGDFLEADEVVALHQERGCAAS